MRSGLRPHHSQIVSKEQEKNKDELARIHALGAQAHADAPEDVTHSDGITALYKRDETTSLYVVKGEGKEPTYVTSLLECESDPGGLRHVRRARWEIRFGP
jgi:hypothetical protein